MTTKYQSRLFFAKCFNQNRGIFLNRIAVQISMNCLCGKVNIYMYTKKFFNLDRRYAGEISQERDKNLFKKTADYWNFREIRMNSLKLNSE